jgi:hypothetical protein
MLLGQWVDLPRSAKSTPSAAFRPSLGKINADLGSAVPQHEKHRNDVLPRPARNGQPVVQMSIRWG